MRCLEYVQRVFKEESGLAYILWGDHSSLLLLHTSCFTLLYSPLLYAAASALLLFTLLCSHACILFFTLLYSSLLRIGRAVLCLTLIYPTLLSRIHTPCFTLPYSSLLIYYAAAVTRRVFRRGAGIRRPLSCEESPTTPVSWYPEYE